MIRALVWKEYREQRAVWLALASLSAGVPIGLTLTFAPEGWAGHESLRLIVGLIALLLAWTQGMVSGATLLAGEWEERTAVFLEGLPGTRRGVWGGKCLAGLALVGAHVALLTATGIGLRYFADGSEFVLGTMLLSFVALTGYAWGLLFSAYTSSALTAILLAFVAQGPSWMLVGGMGALAGTLVAQFLPYPGEVGVASVVVAQVLATLGILSLSAYKFTAEDRRRERYRRRHGIRSETPTAPLSPESAWTPWGRALWLAGRQMRMFTLGLLAFSFLLAFAVLVMPPIAWPMASLLLGVLCGVTAFADEQEQGTYRFLGEQRLPLVPLWVVKVGLRYLLLSLALVVTLLPLVVAQFPYRPPSAGNPVWLPTLVTPGDLLLFLVQWPAYGFGIGVFCGLVFRRLLVAGVVSLGLGALLAIIWVPSLVSGGVHFWQVLGVPALALGASFFLARFWVVGRLTSRAGIGVIAATGLGCLLWTAGGIWYRIAEIPKVPEDPHLPEYLASLPTPEENEAGRLIRGAQVALGARHRQELAGGLGQGDVQGPGQGPALTFAERVTLALDHGWPAGDAELAGWLDEVFADDWDEKLTQAADLPLGVVEDPRHLTFASPLSGVNEGRWAAELLAVRGLQRQAEGKPEVYVENLRVGLALSRNLRNRGPLLVSLIGQAAEGVLLQGLDHWLENLEGRPELLRQVLRILIRHEDGIPDLEGSFHAETLIAHNSLNQPYAWLGQESPATGRWETDLIAFSWLVPWEAMRNRRILRAADEEVQGLRSLVHQTGPALLALVAAVESGQRFANDDRIRPHRTVLHAAQLKAALRLYEAEQGRPAKDLGQLLEKNYLFSIPADPYTGSPFLYRLSAGEEIVWPSEEEALPWEREAGGPVIDPRPGAVFVPAGQGILWSTGPDAWNDGGKEQGQGWSRQRPPGTDWIFLVPKPRRDR